MIGKSFVHYEITARLGEGGMGEVYRAHDRRIDRDVALKILPAAAMDDPERIRRFQSEARAAGRLSHPNLLVLHDLGEAEGYHFLVTELLEGETLAARLTRGPCPWREAVAIAAQVAQGLGAAHAAGLVHRDIKPANIFLTRTGPVKVLDFGLAKLIPDVHDRSVESVADTVALTTHPGTVLGTAGYMAPEQAKGETVDARADLFALGAVLFETLAGRHPFEGTSVIEVLGAVLKDQPSLPAEVRAAIPESLTRTVDRCLAKDPGLRFQSAEDLAFHLEGILEDSSAPTESGHVLEEAGSPRSARRTRQERIRPWAIALAVVVVTGGAFVLGRRLGRQELGGQVETTNRTEEAVALLPISSSGSDESPAGSPDGDTVAFVSGRGHGTRIWLMRRSTGEEAPLTRGPGILPRFSPDGSQVLFCRDDDLYRVSVLGGEARKVVSDVLVADWAPRGDRIAYTRRLDAREVGVFVASPDGTSERLVYSLTDRIPYAPRFSPDGRWIALATGSLGANIENPGIVLIDVESGSHRLLPGLPGGVIPSVDWTPSGRAVIYAQSETRSPLASRFRLVRQPIDGSKPEIELRSPLFLGQIDVLDDGRVLCAGRDSRAALLDVDLTDRGLSPHVLTQGSTYDRQPVYSPDGSWIVFSSSRGGNVDLWSISTRTGETRRITDHPAADWDPAFLPDGRILFASDRSGNFEIWTCEADGSGARQLSHDGYDAENPTATGDGWVVYNSTHPDHPGVWRIRPSGEDAQRIVEGITALPQACRLHGRITFLRPAGPAVYTIGVVLENGDVVENLWAARSTELSATLVPGRGRWLADGTGIAWVGEGEGDRVGVWQAPLTADGKLGPLQPFLPPGTEGMIESFDISPSGDHVTTAVTQSRGLIYEAEGLTFEPAPGKRSDANLDGRAGR